MTISAADVATATTLLAQLADLQARQTNLSTAQTLTAVTAALLGTGLESQILTQSRQNVSDFLGVAIANVEAQLTALGVTFT
jgi:hypothetical protein